MKNLQKGSAVPLIIGIIAVLVIGGGIYYSVNKSNSLVTSTNTADTPSKNETSDWKTYKDETYGFEFKYPSDWVLQKNDPYGWVVGKYPDYGFYLNVHNHPYTLGIESGVNLYKKLSSVDGHKALIGGTEEYVLTTPPTEDSVYIEIETAPYSSSSHMIALNMGSNNHTKEMRKIFSSIISSFKFTK